MKRWLSIVLIVILVLAVAGEFLLPQIASALVAKSMTNLVGSEAVRVTVSKRPALAMLAGEFDQVAVQTDNAKIDKIVFSHLDMALQGVELDMKALLSSHAVVIKSAQNINLTAVITQEELASYLNQSIKGVKKAVVTAKDGKIQVVGNLVLGPFATMAVTLEGKIIGDGQKLKFVTERFLINNSAIGQIGGGMLAEIPLVDLKKMPFGVTVRNIIMDEGKITVVADNHGS